MGTTLFLRCNNGNRDGSSSTYGGVDTTGSVGTTSPSSKGSVSTSDVISDVSNVESTYVNTIVYIVMRYPLRHGLR